MKVQAVQAWRMQAQGRCRPVGCRHRGYHPGGLQFWRTQPGGVQTSGVWTQGVQAGVCSPGGVQAWVCKRGCRPRGCRPGWLHPGVDPLLPVLARLCPGDPALECPCSSPSPRDLPLLCGESNRGLEDREPCPGFWGLVSPPLCPQALWHQPS